jgi:ATP-binding cassette subfamily F protein uup
LEAREYDTIEQRVADADQILQAKRSQLEDSAIVSAGPRLVTAHAEMEEAQNKVDTLYARWAELEKKEELSFSLFSRSLNLIGVWQQQ